MEETKINPARQRAACSDEEVSSPFLSDGSAYGETKIPQIAGYQITQCIGQGGMATVYHAVELAHNRKVALKVVSESAFGTNAFLVERFKREANAGFQLSHKNVVPIFNYGSEQDFHFIAMDLMQGGSLKDKLGRGLPIATGLNIVKELAEALDYLKSKGFLHRDIKPDNVLFRDQDDTPLLADFGLAQKMNAEESSLTLQGGIECVGSPKYMSPERFEGKMPDIRSELYSLGIVLYEILTGAVPYRCELNDYAVIANGHINHPVPLLPARVRRFQKFVEKALAKRPEDRFQSGSEFIAAMNKISFSSGGLTNLAVKQSAETSFNKIDALVTGAGVDRLLPGWRTGRFLGSAVAIPGLFLAVGVALYWPFFKASPVDATPSQPLATVPTPQDPKPEPEPELDTVAKALPQQPALEKPASGPSSPVVETQALPGQVQAKPAERAETAQAPQAEPEPVITELDRLYLELETYAGAPETLTTEIKKSELLQKILALEPESERALPEQQKSHAVIARIMAQAIAANNLTRARRELNQLKRSAVPEPVLSEARLRVQQLETQMRNEVDRLGASLKAEPQSPDKFARALSEIGIIERRYGAPVRPLTTDVRAALLQRYRARIAEMAGQGDIAGASALLDAMRAEQQLSENEVARLTHIIDQASREILLPHQKAVHSFIVSTEIDSAAQYFDRNVASLSVAASDEKARDMLLQKIEQAQIVMGMVRDADYYGALDRLEQNRHYFDSAEYGSIKEYIDILMIGDSI